MYAFHVSILSIIISVIIMMLLGMVWYSPLLFGTIWMKLVGMNKEMTPDAKKKAGKSYALMLIPAIIESYVLGLLIKNLFVPSWQEAAKIAFFAWLGFIATTMSSEYIFHTLAKPKPWKLYVINAGYQLVGLLIISFVLFLFN